MMLCQGCASTAKFKISTAGPEKKPKKDEGEDGFDFWDGELGPENVHPLQAALPNSVWEKYNKHRELLGKPLLRPEHYADAEAKGGDPEPYDPKQPTKKPRQTRLRLWRRRGSLQSTAATVEPHHSGMSEQQLQEHLVSGHGMSQDNAAMHVSHGLQHAQDTHEADHEADKNYNELTHTHEGGGKPEHPVPGNEEELTHHLQHHHPLAGWELDGMDHDEKLDQHEQYHQGTAYSGDDAPNHTHPEEGDAVATQEAGKKHPHPKDMSPGELGQHILDLHGIKPAGLDHIKENGAHGVPNGTDHENLLNWHQQHHEVHSLHGGTPHEHEDQASVLPHSQDTSPMDFINHLTNDHGMKPHEIQAINKGYEAGGAAGPLDAIHDWHELEHAAGEVPGHSHAQQQSEAQPEVMKHPGKFTNSSLHSHLLVDHGIDPDHMANAIDGTFSSTNASHVVHMMHNAAHQGGQVTNPHSHENWDGGEKVHPGHTDEGKPFWGAPPSTMQKHLNHLVAPVKEGGHGMTVSDINDQAGVNWETSDEDAHEAYKNLHGNIHKQGGVEHQHVPTIQPGVKSPEKIKKEKLQQHLKDFHGVEYSTNPQMDHGVLHDPQAYGYKGHPGHEHPGWDQHGPVTQSLPKDPLYQGHTTMPIAPGHHEHPTTMSAQELATHVLIHHKGFQNGKKVPGGEADTNDFVDDMFDLAAAQKSHAELLQDHALKHATGETNGHTHEPLGIEDPLNASNPHHGFEPEIQTKTHPAIEHDSDAIAHILKHHPNVTQDDYNTWGKSYQGTKASVVAYHDALHTKDAKNGNGTKMPKVHDGHDHAPLSGPPTTIAVGSHLVHDHGMDQADVAKMSPAEFKAHHEQLHLKKGEFDLGHGHDYPGGPMRDPKVHLPNTHHEAMRDDSKHPAVQEWYHGTGSEYDGPPKNATELQEDHGFWGNWGGGDWNNHVGTHWTSLHSMASDFANSGQTSQNKGNSGAGRVIHARLHVRNPIVYNSLNHMSHDAYERLRASGHLQDDGEHSDSHDDDNGYNTCCSNALLNYAKGHHRSDGKYGVEAYRDSLRASGHDGILVRNQADSPHGHWNAVPLSADQIEITHGGCKGTHDDERDDDVSEFNQNATKLKKGWVHPKSFSSDDYVGRLGHLPDNDEVNKAHELKKQVKPSVKDAPGRGDSDPYTNGRNLGSADGFDDEDNIWCEHCEADGDHESEDCQVSKYCSVCEDHGDHEAQDYHEHCDHCNDYADHDSDDHEDEYGEHPDHIRKEGYCPHCDTSTKDNYNQSDCQNCGKQLPDWGKLMVHGKPVAKGEYKSSGETENAKYLPASQAKKHGFSKTDGGPELAAHLYHHHGSDVGGKAFETADEQWDPDALSAHHQWLHHNSDEAERQGFSPVDHSHKSTFGKFKPHSAMTPEAIHAHMLLSHVGKGGGVASHSMADIMAMTPEEAVEAHKKSHDADDAVAWGEKDHAGDLKPKISHTHDVEATSELPGMSPHTHMPTGDALVEHMGSKAFHTSLNDKVTTFLKGNPKVAEALHTQMHENSSPASEPHSKTFHVHDESFQKGMDQHAAIKKHLIDDHGAPENHYEIKGASVDDLMTLHQQAHAQIPVFKTPDHTHIGGVMHKDPDGHTAATMKQNEAPKPQKKYIHVAAPTVDKWGPTSLVDHLSEHHPDLAHHHDDILDLAMDHGQNSPQVGQAMKAAHEEHEAVHAPLGPQHPDHYHYDHEEKTKPEGKTSSRQTRTLSDLFEEVAL